jgi:hypothetical protein
MKKIIVLICFFAIAFSSEAQTTKLDSLAKQYFTQAQIDTMSQAFIKCQNYIIRYSWNIYHRWDKNQDTIVNFNRDTIDIRPFLTQRKESKPTYIYDVYPGLVLVLDSKEAIRYRIIQIYSEQ